MAKCKRCGYCEPKKTKKDAIRATVLAFGEVSSQLCDHCALPIRPGDKCYASVNAPVVAHQECCTVAVTTDDGHVTLANCAGFTSECIPSVCVGEDRYPNWVAPARMPWPVSA